MAKEYVSGFQRRHMGRQLKNKGVDYKVHSNLTQIQLLAGRGKTPQEIARQLGARQEDVLVAFETLGLKYKANQVGDLRRVRDKLKPDLEKK